MLILRVSYNKRKITLYCFIQNCALVDDLFKIYHGGFVSLGNSDVLICFMCTLHSIPVKICILMHFELWPSGFDKYNIGIYIFFLIKNIARLPRIYLGKLFKLKKGGGGNFFKMRKEYTPL